MPLHSDDDEDEFSSDDDEAPDASMTAAIFRILEFEKMIDQEAEDRVTHWRTPMTSEKARKCHERLEKFMIEALKHPPKTMPTARDLRLWMNELILSVKPRFGRPIPGVKSIEGTLAITIAELRKKWRQSFHFGPDDAAELRDDIIGAMNNGKLSRGNQSEGHWIGLFAVSEFIIRAYSEVLSNRVASFGYFQMSITSLCLQYALCCRSGEVVLSRHITNEYMRRCHVQWIWPHSGRYEDLQVQIKILYEKGSKFDPSESRMVWLKPVADTRYKHICPMKHLIVMMLRNAYCDATAFDEFMDLIKTTSLAGKSFPYHNPDWPLFPHQGGKKVQELPQPPVDFSKPAFVADQAEAMNYITKLARVVQKMKPHYMRKGALRDLKSVKDNTMGVGPTLASHAGHDFMTYASAVTATYAMNESFYPKRPD